MAQTYEQLQAAYDAAMARTQAAKVTLTAARAAYDAANDGHAMRCGSPERTAAAQAERAAFEAWNEAMQAERACYERLMAFWNAKHAAVSVR